MTAGADEVDTSAEAEVLSGTLEVDGSAHSRYYGPWVRAIEHDSIVRALRSQVEALQRAMADAEQIVIDGEGKGITDYLDDAASYNPRASRTLALFNEAMATAREGK